MKKLTISILIVSVAVLVFTGAAFAQTETPLNPGFGGGPNTNSGSQMEDGWLHDYMIEYYADTFGIDVDTLNDRLLTGETLVDVAASMGYTFDEYTALMDEARQYALSSALADGTITQAEYDLMITTGSMMNVISNMGTNSSKGGGQSSGHNSRSQSGTRSQDCATLP